MTANRYCPACDDGEGGCVYPYYGVAPHECFYKITDPNPKTGVAIGSSRELPVDQWPENFLLDPASGSATGYPRAGTYTHCLVCGSGSEGAK